ncbi:hypothetical protein [Nocardioides jiangxiensis]|uniref:Uncharacterized protein n=1 Tax=Nocardioides jiangxiensis TaxID=3064524 RepID=A0ABT9B2S6_9ACTN|nr:hypothetical protein [Nocardioides sp. WY-20]MDO7867586.1 hypothetical protein [Nocardioides sp. WY-20]
MDLEQQLTAALEGRASGVPVTPADLGAVRARARSIRRRRIAGGAVAGAAVVALVVPAAIGLGGLRSASEAPPVGPAPTSVEPTPSTPGTTCSSIGVAKPTRPDGLPPAVARTWQQIVDAAAACDLSALEALGADATTSYGLHGGITNLRRWEREGKGELGTLLKVMATTPGQGTKEGGNQGYVGWPALSVRARWQSLTPSERSELETFVKPADLASYEEMQMYYGWRVGIRADGTWMYFIAGD